MSDKIIYTCPMHPEIREDNPGRCPKCGMDLVEAQTDAEQRADKGRAEAEQRGEYKRHGGCCH